jgi:4a-hydroxytetrahydrobiopterin dehydratase
MSLTAKQCTPCRGSVPPLSRAEAERLLRETPGWTLDADATRIERTFKTADFAAALALVEQIAAIAEAEGHHPDIGFGWGYCRVVFYTHKIKGLHENDFIMAAKVNALAAASRAAASHG